MCGRFAQYQGMADYLRELNSEQEVIGGYDNLPIERYNVAPQTNVQLLHAEGGGLTIAAVRWGWAPHWAMKGKMPAPINARAETVASGKFFKQIWPYRALVAADGWYEWVKDETDPKHKQPYFIRLRSGEPMFFAAIGQLPHAGSEIREDDGFVIITADAQGGMLDIHDRRPVVLPADLAREWIDPNTTSQRAEQIVQELGLQSEAFEWYQVSKAVGNVKNTGAALIGPTRQALIDRRRDAPVSCDWREAANSCLWRGFSEPRAIQEMANSSSQRWPDIHPRKPSSVKAEHMRMWAFAAPANKGYQVIGFAFSQQDLPSAYRTFT